MSSLEKTREYHRKVVLGNVAPTVYNVENALLVAV